MSIKTILTKFSVLLPLLLIGPNILAQNCKCEEAVKLQDQYILYLQQTKIDSARIILNEIKKFPSPGCQSIFYDYSAFISYRQREYDDAKKYLQSEFDVLSKNGCPERAFVNYYSTRALIYCETDILDSATISLLKAIKIGEENDLKEGLGMNYMTLASVFGRMNQIEKAISYIRKSIKLNENLKDYFYLSRNYNMLGTAYSALSNSGAGKIYFDSVNYALDKAYLYTKMSGNLLSLANILYGKAVNYEAKGDYKISELYIDSCISLAKKDLNESNLPNWYLKKAEINHSITGNTTKALQYCDSALKYARYVKSLSLVASVYEMTHKLYKANGDFKNALEAHELMVSVQDSLHTNERSEAINELEKKYNQVKNEKTISELNQQREIDTLKMRSIIALSLLVLLIIWFFIRQGVTKNKFKTIAIEQKLNRARMNPHFFFNALTSIQALSEDNIHSKEVPALISKFSKIMRQSLESTYDELVTIEAEIDFIQNYLELQKNRYPDKFDYEITSSPEIDSSELKMPGMLLQPFIENSIEHGFKNIPYKGIISISFILEEGQLKIVCNDNGEGFQIDQKHKTYPSRASQIIKERLLLLNKQNGSNARFDIHIAETKGVEVVVCLPIIK